MTIVTTDNQELTVLQLGKIVKYIDEQGEEDYRAEPSNTVICKDKDGNRFELELTAIKYWCKPFTFLTDNTTEDEDEHEKPEPLKIVWTLDSLLNHCCTRTGITAEELCIKTKKRTVTAVRGLFCYLACKLTSSTLSSIGDKICQPHDMVIYYRNVVHGYIESKDKQTLILFAKLNISADYLFQLV